MTSPWSYTGKAAPQAKPMASSAAPQRPARVVADWVPIHTPNRNQGTHDGKARAQATEQGFKNKTTILQGGTPKRLFPTAVDSADRQHETATAATPDRIKADKKHSLATSAGLQDAPMASRTSKRIEHDRNTHVRTHAHVMRDRAPRVSVQTMPFKGTTVPAHTQATRAPPRFRSLIGVSGARRDFPLADFLACTFRVLLECP